VYGRVIVELPGTLSSADLGGSSNDSCEKHEHRRGERFRRKGNPLRVSRS